MQNPTIHSLLGLGAIALCALTFVKDPPGAYFLGEVKGEKIFLIHAFEFGQTLNINSHHANRLRLMFDNLKELGLIRSIDRPDKLHSNIQGHFIVKLPAIAEHTDTTNATLAKTMLKDGKGETNGTSQETFTGAVDYYAALFRGFAVSHISFGFTGWDNPDMWSEECINRVTKAFAEKGSAGLTDRYEEFSWEHYFAGYPQPRVFGNRRGRKSVRGRKGAAAHQTRKPIQKQSRGSRGGVQAKPGDEPEQD